MPRNAVRSVLAVAISCWVTLASGCCCCHRQPPCEPCALSCYGLHYEPCDCNNEIRDRLNQWSDIVLP